MKKKVGRYMLTKEILGKGSFAVVYKGYDMFNHKEYAVKVIQKSKMNQDEYLMGALFNEINILKHLRNENIVRLQDVLQTGNNYYIIQEYCKDGTLRQLLKAKGKLQQPEALSVFLQLLNGFTDLIKAGIIHRDIKPENILVSGETIKLADFGLARYLNNFKKQQLESYVGTPQYMSPQLLLGTPYTSKSDIWSLGVILYELLTGKQPLPHKQTLNRIYVDKIRDDLVTPLSEGFKDLFHRCLQFQEEDRISWAQLFQHPLIIGHFIDYVGQLKGVDQKMRHFVIRLRSKVIEMNVDIKKLFMDLDITRDNLINKVEFYRFMLSIDKNLTTNEIMEMFSEFDRNGDQEIDFTQFEIWMKENKISPELPYLKKNPESRKQHMRICRIIRQTIGQKKLSCRQFFSQFDYNETLELEIQEFKKMILRLDIDLSDSDLKYIFDRFDSDHNGSISFQQFQTQLLKIVGQAPFLDAFTKQRIEKLKLMQP